MIGFYNYTVILTYVSLLISVQGIYFAADGNLLYAMFCLLASGVCDMFDGMIARTRKNSTEEEKRFGIQIDSLCDVICFGVLPAVVGVKAVMGGGVNPVLQVITYILAGAFVVCALIRLAYFNVTEETRQATEGGHRKAYQGVPVTTVAMVFPMIYAVAPMINAVLPALTPWVYPAFLGICATAFILPVRVPKPRAVGKCIMGVIGGIALGLLVWQLF